MLRYSTYKSIYDNKPAKRNHLNINIMIEGLLRRRGSLIKIVALVLFLTVTTTGMVTAFASNGHERDNTSYETVIVVPGDTLWEIAVNHKPNGKDTRVYIDEIKRVNKMVVSSIQAGDTLLLPEI
ncbi:putative RNA-binding protein associated with RNAse of E/G family [Fontibacillus solani]|uniref:Putative RNA-binding protein associated with RNAse of E/G family n=1 Tax=Fontibacillus solani TaxID=1572857 RepID=A0A7W3SQ68_9BACL|nr:LysM peptidoglycan-binding domain-containing protein [Fontibacillus solani]MBA9084082.1 putative RNA-binding protein associated with RNAse of E/G family [Fontibacillus solani]